MADPRQITDLPVATTADDVDLLLMRQGLFDKQVEVQKVRSGLLKASNNLSDVTDPVAARANLGVNDPTDVLKSSNNLSDLTNTIAARTNLGVSATGEVAVLSNNLSDVPDKTLARGNLGVPATGDAVLRVNNLNDVANAETARTNLGFPGLPTIARRDETNEYNFNIQDEMQLRNYSETSVTDGGISTSYDFNLQAGNVRNAIVTGNVTVSFSNPPATGQAGSLFMILENGGSFTITWPNSVVWSGGTAPALTATGKDLLIFVTTNGGATWYGALAGLNMV